MMPAAHLPTAPRLGQLLEGIAWVDGIPDVVVSGVAQDSRKVGDGYLFFALAGEQRHGLNYFDDVVAAGAVAVLVDAGDTRIDAASKMRAGNAGVLLISVSNLAQQVGLIAARFYAHPSQKLQTIGVTGTDGKTSVSQFIARALHTDTTPSAVIGTLGCGVVGQLEDTGLTTPDAVSIQAALADFAATGVTQVAMEVSSHAVVQGRSRGIDFDIAILTNLGRDHLDYHGTVDAYHNAKLQLLQLPSLRSVVVNVDDKTIRRHLGLVEPAKRICYAIDPEQRAIADVFAEDVTLSPAGIEMMIVTPGNRLRLRSQLIGRFNVENLLATFACLRACGLDDHDIVRRLSRLTSVPGRAECFTAPEKASVVVDYSHTPQALEAILRSIREHCHGELWCVFGCGGDRDKGKRPLMARAAESFADHVVVTDDNPRTENGDSIVADTVKGFDRPADAMIERDRKKAIVLAVESAGPSDWVVVAGKGHEDYQIIGTQRIHLSDREIVTEALRGVSNVRA